MKKVLVTGADGFIGSHLTEMLLEKGYNVKALSYYNSFNYWGWLDDMRHPAIYPYLHAVIQTMNNSDHFEQ